jgi:hypothetical protein
MSQNNHPRLIAFYLPQYHPIPENDAWWGKGFTEWTNVVKARPLFKGHYQPHLPADLGFYDLRVPEVRQAQADMAREHGIEGFCYWHYWFAGKRLLERPFDEVLHSGNPDFPFCLAWANETWSGIWHAAPDRILMEQTYPGKDDHEKHFMDILPALNDPRYLTIEGKPIFVIYKPTQLPEPKRFIEIWQNLAIKNGLQGIFFLGLESLGWNYDQAGFDGIILDNFVMIKKILDKRKQNIFTRIFRRVTKCSWDEFNRNLLHRPATFSYRDFIGIGLPQVEPDKDQFPTVYPNWDNTPRSSYNGYVLLNSSPELFRIHMQEAVDQVIGRAPEKRIVFIKSWNEWAEGNYLEPDQQFGTAYLQVIREITSQTKGKLLEL